MTHAMVDTETLGKKPGCAILSIGAALFDPFGRGHVEPFYRTIDLTSSLLEGFTIDPDTLQWWKGQNKEAQAALSVNTHPVREVFGEFQLWCTQNNVEQVWAQGATFDPPILEEGFALTNLMLPWKFYNIRDTRTIYDICAFDYKSVPREGVYHNALSDAVHQVRCVQTALDSVGLRKIP